MHYDIVWLVCVPIPLSILGVWGAVRVVRNWRQLRW